MENRAKYDYKIDLSDSNTSHVKLINLVGHNKKVLELGCAGGYMTRIMKEKLDCRVTGIEVDPKSAETAGPFCEALIIGDVEAIDFENDFSDQTFDVILIADLLEHLKAPATLLRKLKPCLAEDGYLLLSLPNGAHGSIALEILDGKWDYRDIGLLDRTHLHFFDKDHLFNLFDETGYLISQLDRVVIHPKDTEMKSSWEAYPREVTAYIEKANPEYQTYQFIIKAYPASVKGWKIGLEDAVKAEREKNKTYEDRLTSLEKEMVYYKGHYLGFEAELKKQRDEFQAQVANEQRRLGEEIDRLHGEYQKRINELETELGNVHAVFKKEEARLAAEAAELYQRLAKADKQAAALRSESHYFESRYLAISDHFEHLQSERNTLEQQLNAIRYENNRFINSVLRRLITRYRIFFDKWMPLTSARRRGLNYFLGVLLVFYREGAKGILRRVARKITYRLGDAPPPAADEQVVPLHFPVFDTVAVSIVIPLYNQWHHTAKCLNSILRNTSIAYEIIIIDNASDDETPTRLDRIQGVNVILNETNKGFVEACNQGAAAARGEYVLFLNNDTEVAPGWMDALLEPFDDDNVGAVGAKLIYPDGTLQEAGGIIWKDATGCNYGRGDDPDLPCYNYRKAVDYCSGACLMIRKRLWDDIGGFDMQFAPAYYEDTDLCFSVRERGYQVIYQPKAVVTHFEGATAGTDLNQGLKKYQTVNLSHFKDKWQTVLTRKHYDGPEHLFKARERGWRKIILVVDHYAPTYDMDSGSLRMFNLLRIFKQQGYKVIFWPDNTLFHERYTTALQDLGIEALYGQIDFETYIKAHGAEIDYILLSRPHIALNYIHLVKTCSRARIIYDTVDLHFLRESRRARFEAEKIAQEWKVKEMTLFSQADDIFVVSPVEKDILEQEGVDGKISVISNIHELEPTRLGFDERKDLMFIGGFLHTPNEDGILWFVEDIFPLIQKQIPDIHFYIVGSHPSEKLLALADDAITVTGYVEDVSPFFEKCRIFVSPLRYGAGVKGKIGQSLAYGLPIVTTSIGAEGMGLIDGEHCLIADRVDDFAEKAIAVYNDRELWESFSENGKKIIESRFSPSLIEEKLKDLFPVEIKN